jgi:hypothetical protein
MIVVGVVTLVGFTLRLYYATTTHPFFDEYTTVLAARQILHYGWPRLPSGLFYEHGLLATYLITPFTALYINSPPAGWQPAHWGLMLSRWPNVLLGTATIPLTYRLGRQAFAATRPAHLSRRVALLAAGLLALSPEGMVWGGRARMYTLATFLVLLTVYWAYCGAILPAQARYRRWALLTLLATLLTQFGALLLVPPLLISMVGLSWLRRPRNRVRPGQSLAWLRPALLLEGSALAMVVGLALLVKRLGRPLGAEALPLSQAQAEPVGHLFSELLYTIAYQTTFHFAWSDTVQFLARQFGVPHHFWLTVAALAGLLIGLVLRLRQGFGTGRRPGFTLFLALVFGLIIFEMVLLLEPFRRNPRYIVMFLPLFYLLAARAIFFLLQIRPGLTVGPAGLGLTLALLLLLGGLGWPDLKIALQTPEPAYEQAFAYVRAEQQPGDRVLTMNTPAAALYLNQVDGFTVQNEADQFLLTDQPDRPVDRWLGAPWVGTVPELNRSLNQAGQVWFVIDTIRQPVYFRGDWLALISQQMEPVWSHDNALVYRSRPDRLPLPEQPEQPLNATFGGTVRLLGYQLRVSPATADKSSNLRLTLFWQALATPGHDYTIFLHVRNQAGATVAQGDAMPLVGAYPTGRWQSGESIIDPLELRLPADLPPGNYTLYVGLYRLDTLARLPLANDTSGENAVILEGFNLP